MTATRSCCCSSPRAGVSSPGRRCPPRAAKTRSSSPSAAARSSPWPASGPDRARTSSRPSRRSSPGTATGSCRSRAWPRSRPSSGSTGTSASGISSGWPRASSAPGTRTATAIRSSTSGTARRSRRSSRSRPAGPTTGTRSGSGTTFFVAHADHAGASVLYRWDGTQLRPHQALAEQGGRAFATFDDGGATYLVVACISAPTTVMRWDGGQFTPRPDARRPRRAGARGRARGRPPPGHPDQLHPRHAG